MKNKKKTRKKKRKKSMATNLEVLMNRHSIFIINIMKNMSKNKHIMENWVGIKNKLNKKNLLKNKNKRNHQSFRSIKSSNKQISSKKSQKFQIMMHQTTLKKNSPNLSKNLPPIKVCFKIHRRCRQWSLL